MTLNAWAGLQDPSTPKNIREGEPYTDPQFEELARTYGVWGTAQAALCAEFWQAARRAQVVKGNHVTFQAQGGEAAPVQMPEPVLYVSPGQLANHTDLEYPDSGRYIPARKTQAGNFTCGLLTEQQFRQLLAAQAKQGEQP